MGIGWDRYVVTNLERGRRQNVTVDELLALAYVLNVAPVHLLVPIDDEDRPYAVVPASGARAGVVRQWIRGLVPLPSTDRRRFFSFVPEREWVPPGGLPPVAGGVLDEHEIELDLRHRDLSGDVRINSSEGATDAD